MLKVVLLDGSGRGNKAKINGEGEVSVVVHPHPPKDEKITAKPFRQYFRLNGSLSGSNDMRVNGATTNQFFSILADQSEDIYIKTISVLIADATATLNKFGNLTALTNGIVFRWVTTDIGETIIHEGLKTNFNFIRLAQGQPAYGDGATAFQAANMSGTSEGYLPVIDLEKVFGMQYGLRLRAGTNDKIEFVIRDDVSGVDEFNIIGYGIRF